MKAKEAAEQVVKKLRAMLAQSDGDGEAATLKTFLEIVGSEMDGLEMRLDEIEGDEQ